MKITRSTLEKVRDLVLEEGEFNAESVAELLGVTAAEHEKTIASLPRLLKKHYPQDFGDEPESEQEDVDEDETGTTVEPRTYQLIDEKGFLHDLEVFREKEHRVVLKRKVPTDNVRIIVRGEEVEVDLFRLRQLAATEIMHGVTVARLIELAELAKG